MTIQEYIEVNCLSYKKLAELIGCSTTKITDIARYGAAVKNEEYLKKFKELGIDVRVYTPKTNKKKESGTGYLYYEKMQVAISRIGDIYCYTLQKVNAVTQYLDKRGICYYVKHKDDYWVVKYDRTIEEEEWVQ